jgi:hypothetical protein
LMVVTVAYCLSAVWFWEGVKVRVLYSVVRICGLLIFVL